MNSILKSKSSLRAAVLVGSIAALLFPAKGSAADAFFIGSAGDHNLTTPSNWVGGTAAGDWDRLVFGSDVVDGTLNLNNFNGRSGITLTSGLTQDITIVNNQPLIMASVGGDGFIDMSAATHNLTIYAQYWDWSPIEWNVGSGATLFVNGGIYENGPHSLTKDGAGTAWITAAGNRTGTTIINGGALVALRSTLGTKPPPGSGPAAAASPRGRGPMASSSSRRLSFWTGSPISSRRRGSTGIATTEYSRRTTSCEKPSRRWPSGTLASHGRPRTAGMGTKVATLEAVVTRIKSPARTTPPGLPGPS